LNDHSVKLEVIRPAFAARIVQPDDIASLWIKRGEVTSFVTVAVNTGQAQIIGNSFASMFFRDDVVNLMGQMAETLVNQAILTAPVGETVNMSSQSIRDIGHVWAGCGLFSAL
jgi:hypothetical protein